MSTRQEGLRGGRTVCIALCYSIFCFAITLEASSSSARRPQLRQDFASAPGQKKARARAEDRSAGSTLLAHAHAYTHTHTHARDRAFVLSSAALPLQHRFHSDRLFHESRYRIVSLFER